MRERKLYYDLVRISTEKGRVGHLIVPNLCTTIQGVRNLRVLITRGLKDRADGFICPYCGEPSFFKGGHWECSPQNEEEEKPTVEAQKKEATRRLLKKEILRRFLTEPIGEIERDMHISFLYINGGDAEDN